MTLNTHDTIYDRVTESHEFMTYCNHYETTWNKKSLLRERNKLFSVYPQKIIFILLCRGFLRRNSMICIRG